MTSVRTTINIFKVPFNYIHSAQSSLMMECCQTKEARGDWHRRQSTEIRLSVNLNMLCHFCEKFLQLCLNVSPPRAPWLLEMKLSRLSRNFLKYLWDFRNSDLFWTPISALIPMHSWLWSGVKNMHMCFFPSWVCNLEISHPAPCQLLQGTEQVTCVASPCELLSCKASRLLSPAGLYSCIGVAR